MPRADGFQGDRNPGHKRRVALMQTVEAEFGEPVRDVILGFRRDGHSWNTIAGAMDIAPETLRAWRHHLGLRVDRRLHCPRAGKEFASPADRKARRLGYEDAGDAIRQMRCGDGLTVRQVAARLGVSVSTIVDRTPAEARVAQSRTPAKIASALRNLERVQNRGYRGHPWRLDEDARRSAT